MEVGVCSNASFIWRSLMWSRNIVAEGRSWRVGNGQDISVWRDRWLVGLDRPLGELGEAGVLEGMRVGEIIEDGVAWNEGKIRSLFGPFVTNCILNTPIGERGQRDEVWWKHDPGGNFSVKSAYLLEMGFYTQHPNTSEPDRRVWSRMSIPSKARIFLWRAFSDLIPTNANLLRHHVPSSGICELCGDRWDDTEHCLLHCPKIVGIWKGSRFYGVVKRAHGLKLFDVAGAVFKEWGEVDYELWAIMLWQVWGVVCKLLHPDGGRVELTSEDMCVMLWEEYQSAKPTFQAAAKLGVSLGEKRWRRPKTGRFRVDVDALFNHVSASFGVGIVVRDEAGSFGGGYV